LTPLVSGKLAVTPQLEGELAKIVWPDVAPQTSLYMMKGGNCEVWPHWSEEHQTAVLHVTARAVVTTVREIKATTHRTTIKSLFFILCSL
jgi:hypothetical protein